MKMGQLEKFIVNSASHSRRVSRHAEKMLQFAAVRPGQSYLDVGCGNGAAAIQIAKKLGLDVTGVDVDRDQIQAAKDAAGDLPNVRFLTADATRLPFNDREFDVVTTNKVTHHLPNWEIAVAEMIRVLRPNGYLVYGDLLFPGWLAAFGSSLLKNMGFPTVLKLDSLADRGGLTPIHMAKTPAHYEAIWQRQAGDCH